MAVQPRSLTLVQAAKEGDEAAFEVLLEPLLDQGYRLACGFLHDHQAAEDAVQEAAIKAWRKLDRLREGSEMRPWFLGIVANECRSTRRSRWWTVLRQDQPEAIQEPHDDTILEGVELRRALRAMDPAKRLVLVLHWYLDLPLEEIAVITGSSVHGVESRLLRAKQELKRRMEVQRGRP
ncbi:MAG TPA: RNA polymerase sigma factor [Candidatus Dormibacteraeota bacterium]|jgi:RNA polymerase sigma-70 factor (ECF subfamily)|nr:RNA polymerase sigma factor [Candidatus Dormibacteraeota bacterium]